MLVNYKTCGAVSKARNTFGNGPSYSKWHFWTSKVIQYTHGCLVGLILFTNKVTRLIMESHSIHASVIKLSLWRSDIIHYLFHIPIYNQLYNTILKQFLGAIVPAFLSNFLFYVMYSFTSYSLWCTSKPYMSWGNNSMYLFSFFLCKLPWQLFTRI